MTKCESIYCAKKVWRNGRGRTAKDRRDDFLKDLRWRNRYCHWPKDWAKWHISNEIGATLDFYGTLRMAKFHAHKMMLEFGLSAEVKHIETGIIVYATK